MRGTATPRSRGANSGTKAPAATETRSGTLTRASHGIVFSGFVAGVSKNGYRGTAREKTRTRDARLAATRSGARVASLGWMMTDRNMSVKTRRMWIPRPMDWNGRSKGAAPGIAMSTSAAITAARYATRYGHREAGNTGVGCAVSVAIVPPHGTIGAGSIASSSIGLPAARDRYGVGATVPITTAHASPMRPNQTRNRYPRTSVVAAPIAEEVINRATRLRIRPRGPKTVVK